LKEKPKVSPNELMKVHLDPLVDFGKLNDKAIKGITYFSKIVSRIYLYFNKLSLEYLLVNEYLWITLEKTDI
jgi:hypothetical protein